MNHWNYSLLLFLGFLVFSCSSSIDPAEKRNSKWVECVNSGKVRFIQLNEIDRFLFDEEFTGKVIRYYDSGKIRSITMYEEAFPTGESSEFYANGQERFRVKYFNSSRDGEFINTYDNGVLCSKFRVVDGLINDTAIVYSYNGDSLHMLYMEGHDVELLEEYNLPSAFEYKKYLECMK